MTISNELGNQPPLEYLAAMLHRSDWWEHTQDIIKAIQMVKEAALPLFLEASEDNDAYIQLRATWALGYTNDMQAIGPIVETIQAQLEGIPRYLPKFLAIFEVPHWKRLFPSLDSPNNRKNILMVDALYAINNVYAVDLLLSYLRFDESLVRIGVLLALSKIGKPAIVPLMKTAQDPTMFNSVIIGLSRILNKSHSEYLVSLLEHQEKVVRHLAAYSLAQYGDGRALPNLIEMNDSLDSYFLITNLTYKLVKKELDKATAVLSA